MTSHATVFVVSPDTRSERKFDLHLTIKQLKAKLEPVTGIPESTQLIQLYNTEEESTPIASLSEDERPLGYYSVHDWQVLKVTDTSPPGASLVGQFTDVSQVEKFELSEKEYEARRDTVRAYKQAHKLGRFGNPIEATAPHETQVAAPPDVIPGARCEVEPISEDGLVRRGTVRFVGPTEFGNKHGIWVGVQYDEPVGKNDGSVNGKQYFSCPSPYGGFVRPEKIKIGDYPLVDIDAELEEM